MLNYQIKFDSGMKWNSVYRRNNKGKDCKHILCFPDHSSEGHKSNEFCGRSIKIQTICPNESKVLIFGNFIQENGTSKIFHINDVISYSILNNNSNTSECPYYFGKEIDENRLYEINSDHKAWRMNSPLTKYPKQYAFIVYLFIEYMKPDYYICVSTVKSPSFVIVSSRRSNNNNELNIDIPTPPAILNQPPFSPVNYKYDDDDEELKRSCIIKSKKDPNLFKFNNLMPHIYDKSDSKLLINNHDQNSETIIEKNAKSMKEMEKTMNDILLSETNAIYHVDTDCGKVVIKAFKEPETNVEREELSFFGDVFDLYNNDNKIEYLDNFGKKCVIYPLSSYLEKDDVNSKSNENNSI